MPPIVGAAVIGFFSASAAATLAGAGIVGAAVTSAVGGAVIGAVVGGAVAAARGEDILDGALSGAIVGGIGGAIGGAASAWQAGAGLTSTGASQTAATTPVDVSASGEASQSGAVRIATPSDAATVAPPSGGEAPVVAKEGLALSDKLALGSTAAQTIGGLMEPTPEEIAEAERKEKEKLLATDIATDTKRWDPLKDIAAKRAASKPLKSMDDFNTETQNSYRAVGTPTEPAPQPGVLATPQYAAV